MKKFWVIICLLSALLISGLATVLAYSCPNEPTPGTLCDLNTGGNWNTNDKKDCTVNPASCNQANKDFWLWTANYDYLDYQPTHYDNHVRGQYMHIKTYDCCFGACGWVEKVEFRYACSSRKRRAGGPALLNTCFDKKSGQDSRTSTITILDETFCRDACLNDAGTADLGVCYNYDDANGCPAIAEGNQGRGGCNSPGNACDGAGNCVTGYQCAAASLPKLKVINECTNITQVCSNHQWTDSGGNIYYLDQSCNSGNGICNATGSCVPLSLNAYWADLSGKKITNSNKSVTVQLIAESAVKDKIINFKINSSCREIPLTPQTITGGKAITTWMADNCSKGNWTFNASYAFLPKISTTSELLNVDKTEQIANPNATIVSPKFAQIFLTNAFIPFNQSSFDDYYPISWTWDFGETADCGSDGSGKIISGSSDGKNYLKYNISCKYSKGGDKTVVLTVSSGTGTKARTNSTRVRILIDDPAKNDQPVAIISFPQDNVIATSGTIVQFDASKSIDAETSFDKLNFTWFFGDGTSTGPTSGKNEGAKVEHLYTSSSSKEVKMPVTLVVNDEQGNSSKDQITVRISTITETCKDKDNKITNVTLNACGKSFGYASESWCNSATHVLISNCSICPSPGDCGSNNFCDKNTGNCIEPKCENGDSLTCNGITGCLYNGTKCLSCVEITKTNIYCSFYKSQDECKKDRCNIGDISQGQCAYGFNKCDLQKTSTVKIPECADVKCTQKVDCFDNKYLVTCTSNGDAAKCCKECMLTKGSLDDVACGGAAGTRAVMPFFDWPQLVAAIAIISLFYFLRIKRKNKIK